MTQHAHRPYRPIDLLAMAIGDLRPLLAAPRPTKVRVRILWAGAKAVRTLGSDDVVFNDFLTLAIETNLIDSRGYWTGADVLDYERRHGREDVEHVLRWAAKGMNPFEKGPLK